MERRFRGRTYYLPGEIALDNRIEFALRVIPSCVPRTLAARPYASIINTMCDIVRAWPELARGPRQLGITPGGNRMVEFTFGHGPDVTVVEVVPHGGEILWLNAAPEYAFYLCLHPWVLAGRTIRMLFTNPDEALTNLRRWTLLDIPSIELRGQRLGWSILGHWRNPDPLANDYWSWPFMRGDTLINRPTAGAQAGMRVMHEIYDRGDRLVLWNGGHNLLIGAGAQFLIGGPGAARTARLLEAAAADLGVPLDLGPPDVRPQQRLPGTQASWLCGDAAARFAWDPTCKTGGTPLDYGRGLFPDMAAISSEIAHMRPIDPSLKLWKQMTARSVARKVADMTAWLDDDLPPILELAMKLDPADPDVAAARALVTARDGWGTRVEPPAVHEPLSRHEAFYATCVYPLCRARSAAPAMFMMYEHADEIRGLTTADPLYLAGMLNQSIGRVIWEWYLTLAPAPLAPSVTLQVLGAEIASLNAASSPAASVVA